MNEFLQQLVSGTAVGCVYALVALGFVLIYKATDVVNFAHGEVMMIGAFLGLTFVSRLQMPYFVGVVAAILCMTVLGALLNRYLLRPLAGQGILAIIVVTLGLSILLRAFASVAWGPETFPMESPFSRKVVQLGGLVLSQEHVAIIVLTAVMVAGMYLFFRFSRLGIAMQATSENPLAAYYVGIPVKSIHSLVWALGAATAGVAGIMLAPISFVHVNMGGIGLKAFPAAVLGGFGSIPGAIVGGVIIGVIESMAVLYLPEGINNVAAYLLLLLILIFRPQGLFGIQSRRRV
ncbi:MAG: branched-chain amino acid ABC transporter permease [Rhodoferax sp.]|nr:branched-chain amino acid ABC transporter permease [Rhodoferax sp.]